MDKAEYKIRPLDKRDYTNNYLDLLEQLTTVDKHKINYDSFCNTYDMIFNTQMYSSGTYIYVIEDVKKHKLIATGTVIIEQKFTHGMSKVGHIEDIVVNKDYRGLNFGAIIIQHLVNVAKKHKCYKVILDCNTKNVGFYKKCNFEEKGVEMAYYFDSKL